MPIYEYDCPKCGVIEVTQRITEPALGKCPTCKRKVKKLISATSFQLKGEGWYVTDYARKGKSSGKGDAAKSDGGASKADGAASTTSSDSAPGGSSTGTSSGGAGTSGGSSGTSGTAKTAS